MARPTPTTTGRPLLFVVRLRIQPAAQDGAVISDRVTAFVSFDRRVPFGISEVSIESLQLHSFALLSAATSVRFIILAVGIGAMGSSYEDAALPYT